MSQPALALAIPPVLTQSDPVQLPPAEARYDPLPREQSARERAAAEAEAAVAHEEEAAHDLDQAMEALPVRPPAGEEQDAWHCAASLQHRARTVASTTSVGWSPCGRLLASSGTDGRVLVWDVAGILGASARHARDVAGAKEGFGTGFGGGFGSQDTDPGGDIGSGSMRALSAVPEAGAGGSGGDGKGKGKGNAADML